MKLVVVMKRELEKPDRLERLKNYSVNEEMSESWYFRHY